MNVTRFVNAPVISAGVMIANIIWYAIRTVSGIPTARTASIDTDVPQQRKMEIAVDPVGAAAEAQRVADSHHITVVIPIDAKLWIMIESVFERPTRPP